MISLANKYRPKTFDDVTSQKYIKDILQFQVDNDCNVNCYLFTGGAGTGKTTCARIFAKELNKGEGLPIEIDAASNNGVEQIRKIIDEAKFSSLNSTYKVYILDECHMLSTGAFNALLKLLEEPPAKTIFIMCTTDPQKIPATVLSRVQRFDFQRISNQDILNRLAYILDKETEEGLEFEVETEALAYIAKIANGGMRDAITMLDKCIAYSVDITMENVVKALGVVNHKEYFNLLESCYYQNKIEIVNKINEIHLSGKDLKLFLKGFYVFIVDLIVYSITKNSDLIQIPNMYISDIEQLYSDKDKVRFLISVEKNLSKFLNDIKWEPNPKPFIIARLLNL